MIDDPQISVSVNAANVAPDALCGPAPSPERIAELLAAVQQAANAAEGACRAVQTACFVMRDAMETVGTTVVFDRGDFGRKASES